jgi:hypothetical protein
MIGERHRPKPPPTAPATRPAGPGETACPRCAGFVPAGGCWCPGCGVAVAEPCWECGRALLENARCCAFCGASVRESAAVQCPECSAAVRQGQGYCAACGAQARPVCAGCDHPLLRSWRFCPYCGGEPIAPEGTPTPLPLPIDPGSPPEQSVGLDPAAARRRAERANEAGTAAYEAESFAEAVRLFRDAVEADPTHAGYWTNLGVALSAADEDVEAMAAYRRALALDPQALSALLFLGQLLLEKERPAEAREAWESVVRLGPDTEEAAEARENLRSLDEV